MAHLAYIWPAHLNIYRTRAIITRSWFETALDYKPRILGPTFLVYVLKQSAILTSLDYKPHWKWGKKYTNRGL